MILKTQTSRYSDAELLEFKTLITKKLDRAKSELAYYQEQITDANEAVNDDYDDISEGAGNMGDLEMLNNLAQRQRLFIQELEMALIRIHNKSYGICVITGEQIDKRRLLAAPTTTKSLAAKNALQAEANNPKQEKQDVEPKAKPQIITKVIRKTPTAVAAVPEPEEDDFVMDDQFDEEEDPLFNAIDIDDIADDYGYEKGQEDEESPLTVIS
jgi:DnaK suppressor protein